MTNEMVIRTHNLTKFFGEMNAVYKMNLEVPRGGIFGFLGPNGAGKSTTIKMLIGHLRPTSGTAEIFGLDCSSAKNRTQIMQKIGYLPERPVAYNHMTAEQFLVYMARLAGGLTRQEARTRALETLAFVELGRKALSPTKHLSAGEKQRLGLANALIHDPELLILDEPTANLDPLGRITLFEKLRGMVETEDKTILISSHILPEVERLCDNFAIASNGTLVMKGTLKDILDRSDDSSMVIRVDRPEILLKRLKQESFLEEAYEKDGQIFVEVSDVVIFQKSISQILQEENLVLKSFKTVRMPVEKVFMDSIGVKNDVSAD